MNVQAFLNTLPIMGRGMLGIFAVMLVIFLLILVLNACTGRRSRLARSRAEGIFALRAFFLAFTPVFWYNSVTGNPYKWRRAA